MDDVKWVLVSLKANGGVKSVCRCVIIHTNQGQVCMKNVLRTLSKGMHQRACSFSITHTVRLDATSPKSRLAPHSSGAIISAHNTEHKAGYPYLCPAQLPCCALAKHFVSLWVDKCLHIMLCPKANLFETRLTASV